MPKGIYKRKQQDIERIAAIGRAHKGKPKSKEFIEKIRKIRTGWKLSPETRKKISDSHKGEKCYLWKGGITPVHMKIRNSCEYKLWRESVKKRDNFCCVWCGARQGWDKQTKKQIKMHVDHIKPFAQYPELRFAIDNGRTLCVDCHRTTDTWGRIPK